MFFDQAESAAKASEASAETYMVLLNWSSSRVMTLAPIYLHLIFYIFQFEILSLMTQIKDPGSLDFSLNIHLNKLGLYQL